MSERLKIEKTCEHCGKVLEGRTQRKYCSRTCAILTTKGCLDAPICQSTHKKRIQCAYCGKYKLLKMSSRVKCCSPDCARKMLLNVPKGGQLNGAETKRKAADAVECPLCQKRLLMVDNRHTMRVHGEDAEALGIKQMIPRLVSRWSRWRKKTDIRITKGYIGIPSTSWPADSSFVRLTVEDNVFILSPATKAVGRNYRSLIRHRASLLVNLNIGTPVITVLGKLLQANLIRIEQDKAYRIFIHLRPEAMPYVKRWVDRKPVFKNILNFIPEKKAKDGRQES